MTLENKRGLYQKGKPLRNLASWSQSRGNIDARSLENLFPLGGHDVSWGSCHYYGSLYGTRYAWNGIGKNTRGNMAGKEWPMEKMADEKMPKE